MHQLDRYRRDGTANQPTRLVRGDLRRVAAYRYLAVTNLASSQVNQPALALLAVLAPVSAHPE